MAIGKPVQLSELQVSELKKNKKKPSSSPTTHKCAITKPRAVTRLSADGGSRALSATLVARIRKSWGNRGAVNRSKDWSEHYQEAPTADVEDDVNCGIELYCGFIDVAVKHAISTHAAWYRWHASKRQAMLEKVWNEYDAFVHQQIIWVKSRPVLTYSLYLWQHEPCLFGWVRGSVPKNLRSEVGEAAGAFPSTVWEIPNSEVEGDAHPTSKPCRLFALPMEMHTAPEEICYEPLQREPAGRRRPERPALLRNRKIPGVCAVVLERMAAFGLKPELEE